LQHYPFPELHVGSRLRYADVVNQAISALVG